MIKCEMYNTSFMAIAKVLKKTVSSDKYYYIKNLYHIVLCTLSLHF